MILSQIAEYKKMELKRRRSRVLIEEIADGLGRMPRTLQLDTALRRPGQVAVIAETKRASPSKGIICNEYDPVMIARSYENSGAAAVSVLTDEKYFMGHLIHLMQVKEALKLPVLRKDFIIDPFQVYESRLMGADAVLLIVAVLNDRQLRELQELAATLGMSCLVEVHTEAELKRAMAAGAEIIGINNRDLGTFKTDLETTFRLIDGIDLARYTVVSESGINKPEHLLRLREHGVHAALVGEALMRSNDPGLALKEMISVFNVTERENVLCQTGGT